MNRNGNYPGLGQSTGSTGGLPQGAVVIGADGQVRNPTGGFNTQPVTASSDAVYGTSTLVPQPQATTPAVQQPVKARKRQFKRHLEEPFDGSVTQEVDGITQDDLLVWLNTSLIRNSNVLASSRIQRLIPVDQGSTSEAAIKRRLLNDLLSTTGLSVEDYDKDIEGIKALANHNIQIAGILVAFDKLVDDGLLKVPEVPTGLSGVTYAPTITYAMLVSDRKLGAEIADNIGMKIPKESMLNSYLFGESMAFLLGNAVVKVVRGVLCEMQVLEGGAS